MNECNGDFLRKKRESLHLTQEQLAQKVHVSPKTISAWELGRNVVSMVMLQALADAFNMPLLELIKEYNPELKLTAEREPNGQSDSELGGAYSKEQDAELTEEQGERPIEIKQQEYTVQTAELAITATKKPRWRERHPILWTGLTAFLWSVVFVTVFVLIPCVLNYFLQQHLFISTRVYDLSIIAIIIFLVISCLGFPIAVIIIKIIYEIIKNRRNKK